MIASFRNMHSQDLRTIWHEASNSASMTTHTMSLGRISKGVKKTLSCYDSVCLIVGVTAAQLRKIVLTRPFLFALPIP